MEVYDMRRMKGLVKENQKLKRMYADMALENRDLASHIVMSGVDLVTVKELMGHKTLAMTLRYARLAPSHKKKAGETLENGSILVTAGKKEGATDAVTP